MNKEDIMKQAQNEKNTEYEDLIIYKAATKGVTAITIICIMIFAIKVVISDLRGLEKVIPFYDTIAILFGFITVTYFYTYQKTHEKKFIFISIISLIIFTAYMFAFIMTI